MSKSKEGCSRVVMWREFNLVNSYTCEASFAGPTRGTHKDCHFNQSTLEKVGHSFCMTMHDMTDNRERVKKTLQDLQSKYPVNGPAVRKGYADDDE